MDEEDWDEDNWDDELVPDAGNLGTSLQGLTYDFEKAIADVVDNSISHGDADNIWIIISNGEDDEDVVADAGNNADLYAANQASTELINEVPTEEAPLRFMDQDVFHHQPLSID